MKRMNLTAYSVNYQSTRFTCSKCNKKHFQIIFFDDDSEEYLCNGCLILRLDEVS